MTATASLATSPREPQHEESFAYQIPSSHTGSPVLLGSSDGEQFWVWFHVTGSRPRAHVVCVPTADAVHVSSPIRHINLAIHTLVGADEVRYLTDAPSVSNQTGAVDALEVISAPI